MFKHFLVRATQENLSRLNLNKHLNYFFVTSMQKKYFFGVESSAEREKWVNQISATACHAEVPTLWPPQHRPRVFRNVQSSPLFPSFFLLVRGMSHVILSIFNQPQKSFKLFADF